MFNSLRSNLTPCCHISLPYITGGLFVLFPIMHITREKKSQPTPSHCDMCQYVESLRLSSAYATCYIVGAWICYIVLEGRVGG
jgi:hypothetical protein